jgi:hypothetical protein
LLTFSNKLCWALLVIALFLKPEILLHVIHTAWGGFIPGTANHMSHPFDIKLAQKVLVAELIIHVTFRSTPGGVMLISGCKHFIQWLKEQSDGDSNNTLVITPISKTFSG